MNVSDLLVDAFGRVHETVHGVVKDLRPEQLEFRASVDANTIAWLVWHLTRVQDDHVADVAGTEQVWTSAGWSDRFALPLDTSDTGYGHSSDQVAAVRVSSDLLTGYHNAVHDQTLDYLRGLSESDLDRIVDERWDPPVTLGVRLVSVIEDDLQHVGQAAFIRGILPKS
ncbi:MAG TPA: DUF664 domain-containing protein [Actinomycetota bacterium]|nr:DUF664 domain-containing protein [Actinomycetota bacterium]